jgi:hypothetical protein
VVYGCNNYGWMLWKRWWGWGDKPPFLVSRKVVPYRGTIIPSVGVGGQGTNFPYSLGKIMGVMLKVVNGMMVVLVTWKTMNQPTYTIIIFLLVQKHEIQQK